MASLETKSWRFSQHPRGVGRPMPLASPVVAMIDPAPIVANRKLDNFKVLLPHERKRRTLRIKVMINIVSDQKMYEYYLLIFMSICDDPSQYCWEYWENLRKKYCLEWSFISERQIIQMVEISNHRICGNILDLLRMISKSMVEMDGNGMKIDSDAWDQVPVAGSCDDAKHCDTAASFVASNRLARIRETMAKICRDSS